MKHNRDAELATEIAAQLGTTAAWGALANRHPDAADAIRAVASGEASTRALPAKLAVAAVAISDPDTHATLTAGDKRRGVTEAVAAHEQRSIGGLITDAKWLRDEDHRAHYSLSRLDTTHSTQILEHVALHGYEAPAGAADEPSVDDATAIDALTPLGPSRSHLSAAGRDTNPIARARVNATTLLAKATWDNTGYSIGELHDAAAVIAAVADPTEPGRTPTECAEARNRCAAHAWIAGGTIDDVATLAGLDDVSDIDDDTLATWIELWSEHLMGRSTNEILTAITAGGTRIRRVKGINALVDATPTIDADAAFALRGTETYGSSVAGTIAGWLTSVECTWDPTHILDLLESHPDLATDIHEHLNDHTDPQLPRCLAEANMAAAGLDAWVGNTDTSTGARLAAAAEAAAFGVTEWALVHRHLPDFRGTPEDLIAMLAEVCT